MREERQSMVAVHSGNAERRRRIIRNQQTVRWAKKLQKSSVIIYASAFLLIITLLAVNYKSGGVAESPGVVAATQGLPAASANAPAKISVDQLSAAAAVTNIAETTNLPIAGDLREATTTLYIKKQLAQTDTEVISKPQIVQPTTSTDRGVKTYVVKEGDSIDTIAADHNISAQTLRWANNTTSDAVEVGKELTVPLVDGVVYTTKAGDTFDSLADKYKVDAERVMLYNDLEADQPLQEGLKIILPNGDLPETERPGYVAPRQNTVSRSSAGSTTGVNYGYARISSGNRYAAGNCTWYAYERRVALGRPVGSLWGNAYSWASSARAGGFLVNQDPQPGSVFQTSSGGGGYGHVGIVERVDEQNVYVSDMNYAGYNVVTHRTIPRSALGGYSFIH